MSWAPKTWKNRSQGAPTTPVDAAGLNDLEARIGTLAGSVAPANGDAGRNHWYPEANQASILAAAAAARDAGGGVVHLPVGSSGGAWAPISVPAGLPCYNGVTYRGVRPVTHAEPNFLGTYEDGFVIVGGTLIQGNGTGFGWYGNTVDSNDPPADPEDSGFYAAGLIDVGLTGYQDGIRVGSVNNHGLMRGSAIDGVYVHNCSRYAVYLNSMMEVDIGWVFSCESPKGQFYGAAMEAPADTNQGNSTFRNVFHRCLKYPTVPADLRKQRGIQFAYNAPAGGVTGATYSGPNAQRVQVNSDPRAELSVTATLASGSTSVAVPNGSEFEPEMLVWFTTTGLGFEADRMYFVKAVSGNNLTLGDSKFGPSIAATGNGTLTLRTKGHVLFSAMPYGGSGAGMVSTKITELDLEGDASAGAYLEQLSAASISFGRMTLTAQRCIVGRTLALVEFSSHGQASYEFDLFTATQGSVWHGPHGGEYWYALGHGSFDGSRSAYGMGIGGHVASAGVQIEDRGGWLYPGAGFGEPTTVWIQDLSLAGLPHRGVGTVVFGSAATTTRYWTLPTITDNRSAISGGFGSSGIRYRIFNANQNHSVVVSSGADNATHNKVAGRTSLTIPPGGNAEFLASFDATETDFFWVVRGTETRQVVSSFGSARWSAAAGYRTPCYYRDGAGVVHIEAAVRGTAATTPNDTIFTLADRYYRPSALVSGLIVIHSATPKVEVLYVEAGGAVKVAGGTVNNDVATINASFLPA